MFAFLKQIGHPKILSLFISIIVFSVIYLLLDDTHFNGVNYIKDTIKKEVIKKKIDKEIEEEPTQIDGFYSLVYSDPALLEKKFDKTTEDVKKDVKKQELTPDKIDTPIFQKLYDRLYFSIVTGTLLGYGDIYPTSNICKFISMIQGLFTVSLIVY